MNKLELFTDSEIISRMIDAGLEFKICGKEVFYLIHGIYPQRVKVFLNSDLSTLKNLFPENDFFNIVEFDSVLWIKEKYPFSNPYQFEVYLSSKDEISEKNFAKSKIDTEPLNYNKIYFDSKIGIVDNNNVMKDLQVCLSLIHI